MVVCVAVDDNFGMMFNNRRQSRDRVLCEHLLTFGSGSGLYMNEYSAKLFSDCDDTAVRVDERFLENAGEDDVCFVENTALSEYKDKIGKFILFKWNKVYPADFCLDVCPADLGKCLTSRYELEGSSHERITVEVWE